MLSARLLCGITLLIAYGKAEEPVSNTAEDTSLPASKHNQGLTIPVPNQPNLRVLGPLLSNLGLPNVEISVQEVSPPTITVPSSVTITKPISQIAALPFLPPLPIPSFLDPLGLLKNPMLIKPGLLKFLKSKAPLLGLAGVSGLGGLAGLAGLAGLKGKKAEPPPMLLAAVPVPAPAPVPEYSAPTYSSYGESSIPYSSPPAYNSPLAPYNTASVHDAPTAYEAPYNAPPAYEAPYNAPPSYEATYNAPPTYEAPYNAHPSYEAPYNAPPAYEAPYSAPPTYDAPYSPPHSVGTPISPSYDSSTGYGSQDAMRTQAALVSGSPGFNIASTGVAGSQPFQSAPQVLGTASYGSHGLMSSQTGSFSSVPREQGIQQGFSLASLGAMGASSFQPLATANSSPAQSYLVPNQPLQQAYSSAPAPYMAAPASEPALYIPESNSYSPAY